MSCNSNKVFYAAYEEWLQACLVEFNDKFGESRKYTQMPEGDYDPEELVEFAEDGDVYPHGRGGTGHIRHAVTPWEKSEFFIA